MNKKELEQSYEKLLEELDDIRRSLWLKSKEATNRRIKQKNKWTHILARPRKC